MQDDTIALHADFRARLVGFTDCACNTPRVHRAREDRSPLREGAARNVPFSDVRDVEGHLAPRGQANAVVVRKDQRSSNEVRVVLLDLKVVDPRLALFRSRRGEDEGSSVRRPRAISLP